MTNLTFADDIAYLQRTLAQCHDLVVRRGAVLQELNLCTGEQVLEVGCGGGLYSYEAARCVGATGRICSIDISQDQITAAHTRCAEFPWVAFKLANVSELPYADLSFDAVYATQVLEYVPTLSDALREIHRVLRPGGRVIIVATNWSSLVWYSNHPDRMKRVLAAWDEHAPYPDLPAGLAVQLRTFGLRLVHQKPLPILNTSYHENSYSYWAARLIQRFVVGRDSVTEAEAEAWLQEFDELEKQNAYFFSSTPILTAAVRVS
jgi:arsenite methyltransferase